MKINDLSDLLPQHRDELQSRLVDCLMLTSSNLVFAYDLTEGRYLFISGDSTPILGYSSAEMIAMDRAGLVRLVHPSDEKLVAEHERHCREAKLGERLEVEYRFKPAFGDWRWLAARVTPLVLEADQSVRYVFGVLEDLSEHRKAEDQVWFASTHDQLTGLYNRSHFVAELNRLEKLRRFPISVLFVDVDGLREVNDKQGDDVGDFVLRRSAQVLQDCFRSEDIVARIGGDEFAVMLLETAAASTEAILSRVRSRLQKNNQSNPTALLSLSMGMATAEYGQSLQETLALAEKRMLDVKTTRQNQRLSANKPR